MLTTPPLTGMHYIQAKVDVVSAIVQITECDLRPLPVDILEFQHCLPEYS